MYSPIIKFKIKGLPRDSEFTALPFGRKIEYYKSIDNFKLEAKRGYIFIKRVEAKKVIKRFMDTVKPKEYYYVYHDNDQIRDDSFQIWYKV